MKDHSTAGLNATELNTDSRTHPAQMRTVWYMRAFFTPSFMATVILVAASVFMSLMLLTFSTPTLQQPMAAPASVQRGEKLCVQT